MNRLVLSLSLLLSIMTMKAAVKIDRIEPTDWFVGMKNTSLQLMVYGEGIKTADVTTDYPGVKVDSLVRSTVLIISWSTLILTERSLEQ